MAVFVVDPAVAGRVGAPLLRHPLARFLSSLSLAPMLASVGIAGYHFDLHLIRDAQSVMRNGYSV